MADEYFILNSFSLLSLPLLLWSGCTSRCIVFYNWFSYRDVVHYPKVLYTLVSGALIMLASAIRRTRAFRRSRNGCPLDEWLTQHKRQVATVWLGHLPSSSVVKDLLVMLGSCSVFGSRPSYFVNMWGLRLYMYQHNIGKICGAADTERLKDTLLSAPQLVSSAFACRCLLS